MPHPTLFPASRNPLWSSLACAAILSAGTLLRAGEPAAETPSPAPAPAETEGTKLKPPVAIRQVAPVHPPELMKKMVNGKAVVECIVTETGAVQDVAVLSASDPQFGEAAAEALKQWEFEPGQRAGRNVPLRLQIPFDFRLTPEQIVETVLGRTVFREITDLVIPAKELPSWPRPLGFAAPRYPQSLKGSGKYGKAVVSLIIDKEGKVLNPRIVKATYPEFGLPALVAAARLEFPPQVMANNERIYVSMDIQFDFKADTEKASDREKPKKQ